MTGLLFLHRVVNATSNNPFSDLRVLEDLCGPDALQNIIFVTTMWDELPDAVEPETRPWHSMPSTRVVRFEDSYQSAWEIVDQIVGVQPLEILSTRLDELRAISPGKPFGREEGTLIFPNLDALIGPPSTDAEPGGNLSATILGLQDAQCVARMYRLPPLKDAVSLGLILAESIQVRNCEIEKERNIP